MFQQLKKYLSHPPIMSSPKADEVLFAYIAVTPHAVSLVLIRVDSGRYKPVYYVSKSLHEAEIRYLPLENAILAVVHCTRKLSHYFQAHTVGTSFELPHLFLLASSPFKLGRFFWSISSSSSSDSESIQVIINCLG